MAVITTKAGSSLGDSTPLLFSIFLSFLNFWLCWVFVSVHGLLFGCRVWDSHGVASLVAENGHNSPGSSACSTQDQLLHGMWDLPGAGIEPVSPCRLILNQ